MAEVQTAPGASVKDTALLFLSILAILGGIVAFYWYDEMNLALRVGMVVLGIGIGAAFAWASSYGREFWQFALTSRVELRKVVWPSKDETIKTTYVVFAFAVLMGLFFFVLDWLLTYMTHFLGGQ
jgi:preprotein translocase subunit SecE